MARLFGRRARAAQYTQSAVISLSSYCALLRDKEGMLLIHFLDFRLTLTCPRSMLVHFSTKVGIVFEHNVEVLGNSNTLVYDEPSSSDERCFGDLVELAGLN